MKTRILLYLLAFLVIFPFFIQHSFAAEWNFSAVDPQIGGRGNDIKVDDLGNYLIAYFDRNNRGLMFAKSSNSGQSWTISNVTGFSSSEMLSLAIDVDNTYLISYMNGTALRLAKSSDGISWSSSLVTNQFGNGFDPSMIVDSNGDYLISYSGTNLKFLKSTDNGANWEVSTVATGLSDSSSIAVDALGNYYISYFDLVTYDLKLAKSTNGGTIWSVSTVDSVGRVGHDSDLVIDTAGNYLIAYSTWDNYDLKFAKSTDQGFSWNISTLDTNLWDSHTLSLGIDSRGNYLISYAEWDFGYLKFASSTNGGDDWIITEIVGNYVGEFTSFAVDPLGDYLIAYVDGSGYLRLAKGVNDVSAPEITLIPLSPDPTTITTPLFPGNVTDSQSQVVSVEYQIDSTSGPWNVCPLSEAPFTESFEGEEFPPVGWETSGDENWFIDPSAYYDGSTSAASGTISNNQTTSLRSSISVSSSTELHFFWKVSSENNYDFLLFCLDNTSCNSDGGYFSKISGEVAWSEVVVPLTLGYHTLVWRYEKDSSDSRGQDKGWIDIITAESHVIDEFTCSISSSLPDGMHIMYLRATDSEGNTTSPGMETMDTFTVDTTPPPFPIDHVEADVSVVPGLFVSIAVPRPRFIGVTEPYAHVTLTIYSDPIVGEIDANGEGFWEWTPLQDIPIGTHRVVASSTDLAGNVGTGEFTLSIGLADTGNGIWGVQIGAIGMTAGLVYALHRRKR